MNGAIGTLGAFLVLAVFIVPLGEVARRALFPSFALDAVRRALVALALGGAGLSLGVAIAWMAGNRLSTALPVCAAMFVALGAVAIMRARRALASPRGSIATAPAARPRRGIVLAIAAAILIAPLLFYQDPLTPIDDSLDHVASLSRRAAQDVVFPASDIYATSRETGPDLRKGLFHGVIALVARSARVPVLSLWNALPVFFAAWALLGVWASARALTNDRLAPLIALALFLLTYDGGLGGAWLTRLGHPGRAIYGPFWAVWALLLDPTLRVPRLLWPILGFTLAAIHSYGPIQCAVTAGFFAAFVLIAGRAELRAGLRALLANVGWLLAGAAPYLAFRMIDSGPAVDTIHTEPQGLFYWTESLFTLNPHWILWGWGAAGLLALPGAIALAGRARSEPRAAFLASGMLGPVVTIANPLAMPVVYRAIGYLGARFTWFTPHIFLLADILASAWRRVRSREPGPRNARFAVLFGAAIAATVAVGVAGAIRSGAARRVLGGPVAPGFLAQSNDFRAVDRAISEPSTILADPATGYAIPALTRHWTVSASPQHTTPNDPDARTRLRDTRRILSPYVSPAETIALLRRYGAGYVLLNDSAPASQLRYLWFAGRRCLASSRAKFDASPDLFEPILDEGALRLYRLSGKALRDSIAVSAAPLERAPFDDVGAGSGTPAGIPGYEFLGGTVRDARVLAGANLAVETRWLKTQDLTEGNRHLVVRLDRREKSLLLSDSPFARLARIASDSWRGERTRARIDYVPGCGFLPPDDWPRGRAIHDESELTVPRSLAPGLYSVRVKLAETPFYPNVRPADFFAPLGDRDGFLLGDVEVLPMASQHD
ncbi:MAG: hypothetical protein ACKVU1_08760 [bacterium]